MSRWNQPKEAASAVFLPHDLNVEILSLLSVKPLMRLRCVSKSWNTLISDPSFVQMHLKRSTHNRHLILTWQTTFESVNCSVVPFPIRRLLKNPSTIVYDNTYERLIDKMCIPAVIGSCNGLIFMVQETCFYIWNPATRTRSEIFLHVSDPPLTSFNFAFGYDNSTGTYKVVIFEVESDNASFRSNVKVFSFGDNSCKTIQCFPVIPLHRDFRENGVYLNGTLNWLALHNCFYYDYFYSCSGYIPFEQYVIVSLDLSTETYSQLLLPRGFDEASIVKPTVGVLMECLCFTHFKRTQFIIWLMKDFGVQESWIQLFKISNENFKFCGYKWYLPWLTMLPLCLSENGDTLLLAHVENNQAFIYNSRDNRVKQVRNTNKIAWFLAKGYVESLVSTC